jgi:peptide/nickel transport system substrate-binding protein
MKRRRFRALAATAAAGGLLLAGCTAGGGTGTGAAGQGVTTDSQGFATNTGPAKKGGTVDVLGAVDFSHLDPEMGNDGNVINFYRLIYRQLTTYSNEPGKGTQVVPDLATDTGRPNADKTVWTYTLKDGLRYQDGTPIKAQDIKFGVERSFDPAVAIGPNYHRPYLDASGHYQGVYKDPAGLKSIVVKDDKTIEFHLSKPLAGFPDIAATGVFTPFPASKVTSPTSIDNSPIASGPYEVDSYTRGSQLTLSRNPYWSAKTDDVRPAYPDHYKFIFGLDPSTVDQRMISDQGEDQNAIASSTNPLLAASLSRIQQPQYKQRTVKDVPNCTTYMALNTTKKPLDDLRVRQAIEYAVDYKSNQAATGGEQMATITHDMLTPDVPGRQPFNLYPSKGDTGDVAKAKQLLAAAGYAKGFNATIDVRSIPVWKAQAEAMQQSLQRVGIHLTLNVIDASTYYEVIATPAKQHDMAITGWCSPWLSGLPLLQPLFDGRQITATGNQNISQFNDPAINKRFDQIAVMTNLDQQNAEYAKLNREILEKAPVVPLDWATNLQMVGSNVGNAFAHPGRTGYIDYTSVGLKNPKA